MNNSLRKIIAIVIIIGNSFCFLGCSDKNGRIIGEWKGTDNRGQIISFVFDKSNHAFFVKGNEVIGGKDYELHGHKIEIKYKINYSKNPYWLDFVKYEDGSSDEILILTGIFRFISDTKIELRFTNTVHGSDRFTKFDPDDKENTMLLDKVPQ